MTTNFQPTHIYRVTETSDVPQLITFDSFLMSAQDKLFWLQFGCRESESYYLEPASVYC